MSGRLGVAEIQAYFDRSPYMTFMGFRVISADPATETLEVHVPMRPEFERGPGSNQWHGGVLSAVVDTVGDFALVMAIGKPLPTINLRIDYLRPAIQTGLRAVGRVRRQGKTVGVADVDVFNDAGVLVAIGRAAYATA